MHWWRTDASRGAAQAEDVAQRIAHQHRLADRLWVVVAARVEDGEEDGVNDGKGDADALVQARVVGLGQVLWRAGRRASHGGVRVCVCTGVVRHGLKKPAQSSNGGQASTMHIGYSVACRKKTRKSADSRRGGGRWRALLIRDLGEAWLLT